MRVRILPATVGGTPGQGLSGYLVDGVLAIDAGPLGFAGSLADQARVCHVLLTHSHLDHVAGLPMLLDNLYGAGGVCPTVYGVAPTLDALRTDLFNGRLMPDFLGMSATMAPFLKVEEVTPHRAFAAGVYIATALPVVHTVPTVGYHVTDGKTAFALFTDTRPIPDVLAAVAGTVNAVFLECSFPRRLARLAEVSGHLATDEFLDHARLLPPGVPVYPIHIKPRFHDEIVDELMAAGLANVRMVEPGDTVDIGSQLAAHL